MKGILPNSPQTAKLVAFQSKIRLKNFNCNLSKSLTTLNNFFLNISKQEMFPSKYTHPRFQTLGQLTRTEEKRFSHILTGTLSTLDILFNNPLYARNALLDSVFRAILKFPPKCKIILRYVY